MPKKKDAEDLSRRTFLKTTTALAAGFSAPDLAAKKKASIPKSSATQTEELLAQAATGTISIYNVRDFGASGDGSADDTQAVNDAVTAAAKAAGGVVFFPVGVYKTTGSVTCPASHIVFLGTGQASIIRPSGNFDTLNFSAPGNEYIYGNRVIDLSFDEAQKTGGRTIAAQFVAQFHAIRLYGGSGWDGWYFHNFNNVTLEHCRFESYRGAFYGKASGGGQLEGRSDVLRIYYLVLGGTRQPGMVGIEVDGFVNTVNGWGVHFIGIGAQALLVHNTIDPDPKHPEQNPIFFTFDDLECDYPTRECIRLDAGEHFFFNNVQLHGSQEVCNIYIGEKTRSVSFTGGFSSGAAQAGICVAGQDIAISAMHFSCNNQSHGPYPGILLGSSSRYVTVMGCISGDRDDTQGLDSCANKDPKTGKWTGVQDHGCQIDIGAKEFIIIGNIFRHNHNHGINSFGAPLPPDRVANNIYWDEFTDI